MSFGFRSGTSPIRTNPKWVRWFKIAQKLQTGNNAPKKTTPLRGLVEKTLKSLNNE